MFEFAKRKSYKQTKHTFNSFNISNIFKRYFRDFWQVSVFLLYSKSLLGVAWKTLNHP